MSGALKKKLGLTVEVIRTSASAETGGKGSNPRPRWPTRRARGGLFLVAPEVWWAASSK
jgi:hypothetical protein